jgi:hypothetical protein
MKHRRYRVVVLGAEEEPAPTRRPTIIKAPPIWRILVRFVELCNWSWQIWVSWACILLGTLILIRTFV